VNIGATLSPVASVVDFHAQPALGASAPAVPTDLPVAQTISQATNIPAARNDSRRPEKATPGPSRVVIIDPQTNAIVFRSLNARTGDIIEQLPTQALLRKRAYEEAMVVQALIDRKNPTAAALAAAQNIAVTT
jgi:hypothetical protein